MARTDTVDIVFWGMVFSTVTVLVGIYQCKNWNSFLEWMTFLGLILDASGALALVLSEFWPIQAFLWPGLVAAKDRIETANTESDFSSHKAFLEQEDDGFEELGTITRNRRTISNPEINHSKVEIEEFCFWPSGDIYVSGFNVNQVTVGSPEEVQVWISERITTLTRNKVYPYAALVLFVGFGLQILSYGLQNI